MGHNCERVGSLQSGVWDARFFTRGRPIELIHGRPAARRRRPSASLDSTWATSGGEPESGAERHRVSDTPAGLPYARGAYQIFIFAGQLLLRTVHATVGIRTAGSCGGAQSPRIAWTIETWHGSGRSSTKC